MNQHFVVVGFSRKICENEAMRAVAILLSLALAGCATGDLAPRDEPATAHPVAPQSAAPASSPSQPTGPSLSSPAAKAAAAPDSIPAGSGLLPCETQSCKINCSAKVPARAR